MNARRRDMTTVALSIADQALRARLAAALGEQGLRVVADERGADAVLADEIEEIAILLAMQDGVPVPEEGDGSERGAEDGVACMLVLDSVYSELVLDGVVHRADVGDGLADQIAKAVSRTEEFGGGTCNRGLAEEPADAAKDSGKGVAHGCDVADRPELVEDKGHDHQRQKNADKAVSGRGELRGSGEAKQQRFRYPAASAGK